MIESWQITQLLDGGNAAPMPSPAGWVVQCDFNGIISVEDTTKALLQRFGRPGWQALGEAWELGAIDLHECLKSQVALLNMSREELNAHLDSLAIDPHFPAFVKAAQRRSIPVQVVSDGFEYTIRRILARHGLGQLPIAANRLVQIGERSWQLVSPRVSAACAYASGTCKCAHLEEQRAQHGKVLFVGDGNSDLCLSHKSDFVLAKGWLAVYCEAQGLAHAPMTDFAQALPIMEEITAPATALA